MAGDQACGYLSSGVSSARSAAEGRSLEGFADGDEVFGAGTAEADNVANDRLTRLKRWSYVQARMLRLRCESRCAPRTISFAQHDHRSAVYPFHSCPNFATLPCPFRWTWRSHTASPPRLRRS